MKSMLWNEYWRSRTIHRAAVRDQIPSCARQIAYPDNERGAGDMKDFDRVPLLGVLFLFVSIHFTAYFSSTGFTQTITIRVHVHHSRRNSVYWCRMSVPKTLHRSFCAAVLPFRIRMFVSVFFDIPPYIGKCYSGISTNGVVVRACTSLNAGVLGSNPDSVTFFPWFLNYCWFTKFFCLGHFYPKWVDLQVS